MPETRPLDAAPSVPPDSLGGDGLEAPLRVLARIIARRIQAGEEKEDDLTLERLSALLEEAPR